MITVIRKESVILEKRLIAVFTAFTLTIGCLCLRLYVVCSKGTDYVSSASDHCYTIELKKIRGEILDRFGEKLIDTDYDNVVVAKPTVLALSALEGVLDTQSFADIKQRMEKSNAVSVNIGKLDIVQNKDALTVKVYKRYADNQSAQHIIGYVNGENRGISGLENSYDEYLYSDKSMAARFPANAYGHIIAGKSIEIANSSASTGKVKTTLDSSIQRIVEDALDISDVTQGGAVVVDISDGAIRAMASRPQYNANDVGEYLNSEGSPLVNRALQTYAVGSIFKVAVAAAALENGISDLDYNCSGSCNVDGVTFHCNKKTAHGQLNMQKALECSCNTYFIALAQKIGARSLLETVSLLGFGQEVKIAEPISVRAGNLPTFAQLSLSGALANFSFGQGNFTASMLQLAQMMAAVAGGGKYMKPYLVESVTDSTGKVIESHKNEYPIVALKESTALRLKNMLISVVEQGNASKAKLRGGIKAAGKTATAQTGTYLSNGVEICNTWFGGFFPADNPKYAVIILKQGGNSGAEDCAPVFKRIADKIVSLY